jgi:murein DD-endopeptidase MepM/ murein hydrolase activator NlpD
LGVISLILFGILTLTPSYLFNSLVKNEVSPIINSNTISNTEKTGDNSQTLFVGEIKKSGIESPDFSLIQKNSLISSCPPVMVTPQILGAITGEEKLEPRKEIIEYTVQKGDTLLGIAEKFNISLNTLVWANDLSSNSKVQIDQALIILPVSGTLHYVKSGETMSEIATKYKSTVEKIVAFNELSGEKDIFAGDILVVPDGIMPATKPTYAEIPLANSYFILPTKGRISQGLHWYNAIDFANACGSPIYAAAGGTVLKVKFGYNQGAGNYLTISHPNGVITTYGHIMSNLVNPGDQVYQGQVIAYVGGQPGTPGAGKSTGCHLHFGVSGARNPFAQ